MTKHNKTMEDNDFGCAKILPQLNVREVCLESEIDEALGAAVERRTGFWVVGWRGPAFW